MLVVLAAAGLAGCYGPPPLIMPRPVAPIVAPIPHRSPAQTAAPSAAPAYHITTPFNEAEFAPYAAPGNAAIIGEAFWRAPDGTIVTAAGREVVLVPDTAYTRELLVPARSGRYSRVANFDPRYFRYRRTAAADTQGRFRFTGLPPGAYILQTSVRVGNAARYGLARPEVFLHRQISVGRSGASAGGAVPTVLSNIPGPP